MDILQQILQALCYLHGDIKVVHRDIKPENFLMYNMNGRNKIKLIDFGFGTFIPEDGMLNERLGTPQYAAPELFSEKPYTSKVDIWATGIVLYNMVNGTQPFSANPNDPELLKEQILSKEINFSGFTDPNLKFLAMKLLERDPDKRPNAFQALCKLNSYIEKTGSQITQTLPSQFSPDIQKIMFILSNDKAIGDELRNIFLTHATLEQITQLYKDLAQSNEMEKEDGMLIGKLYLRAEKIIDFALKQSYINDQLKEELEQFKQMKGEQKLMRQMINAARFFITSIEAKKFIHKQRIWHKFEQLDKESKGFLTKKQIDSFLTDKEKRRNITEIREGERVDFEKFYDIWKDYEGTNN